MLRRAAFGGIALVLAACGAEDPNLVGALALGLTSQAGGATFQLVDAEFALSGPSSRMLTSNGEDSLRLELPAGDYTLALHDGWSLTRAFDDAGTGDVVRARLVSDNPLSFHIEPGTTTQALFRFELGAPDKAANTGSLDVELEVFGDAGPPPPPCSVLRISEIDYEQVGPDSAEFIELVNAGSCAAKLSGVTLELVNGGDGEAYARYPLDELDRLEAGERLVIGSATLPSLATGKHLVLRSSGIQNGPDGVRLLKNDAVIDALAYEGVVSKAGEGDPVLTPDLGAGALARCPDDDDTDDNAADFVLTRETPFAENACE